VGVVDHARHHGLHRDGRFQVYVRNEASANLSWVLRSGAPLEDLVPRVRAVVREVDAQLALADVRPMQALVAEAMRQQRLSVVLVTGFSLATLLLAAMGLFGVVSAAVVRRRRELAVRMALGATPAGLRLRLLGQALLTIGVGSAAGVAVAALSGRFLEALVEGANPADVKIYAGMAISIALIGAVAIWTATPFTCRGRRELGAKRRLLTPPPARPR
jgi:putative ABC transport system permease protein